MTVQISRRALVSGERVVVAMRFSVVYTLVTLALLGCSSPYPDELPPPDLRDRVFVYVTGYQNKRECILNEQLLWESLIEDVPIEEVEQDKCEPCECGPAECVLPSKVTVHASVCPGDGAAGTFDAGASWDGSCAAPTPRIESDAFAAVTFDPPTLASCAPVSRAPEPSRRALAFATVCAADPQGSGPTSAVPCYPPQEDGSCWRGYSVRHELTTIVDTRTCAPCKCGAPSGGKCAVNTILYQDKYCLDELDSYFISDKDPPMCSRGTTGPLAGMRSVFTQTEPGTCAPSVSEVEGGALERGITRALCCKH